MASPMLFTSSGVNTTALHAYEHSDISLSFGGAGFLILYYVGGCAHTGSLWLAAGGITPYTTHPETSGREWPADRAQLRAQGARRRRAGPAGRAREAQRARGAARASGRAPPYALLACARRRRAQLPRHWAGLSASCCCDQALLASSCVCLGLVGLASLGATKTTGLPGLDTHAPRLPNAGVLKVLRQLGIVTERTRVAGISSGALTAGAVCAGLDDEQFHKTVRRAGGGAGGGEGSGAAGLAGSGGVACERDRRALELRSPRAEDPQHCARSRRAAGAACPPAAPAPPPPLTLAPPPVRPARAQVNSLLDGCRRIGCAGRMDRQMRELLDATLPKDAAERCRGRFFAGVTVLDNGARGRGRGWEGCCGGQGSLTSAASFMCVRRMVRATDRARRRAVCVRAWTRSGLPVADRQACFAPPCNAALPPRLPASPPTGNPKSMLAGLGSSDGVKDRSDLISTLAASAYIPIWSGRGCVRGRARRPVAPCSPSPAPRRPRRRRPSQSLASLRRAPASAAAGLTRPRARRVPTPPPRPPPPQPLHHVARPRDRRRQPLGAAALPARHRLLPSHREPRAGAAAAVGVGDALRGRARDGRHAEQRGGPAQAGAAKG
jgi:hypothetical protein